MSFILWYSVLSLKSNNTNLKIKSHSFFSSNNNNNNHNFEKNIHNDFFTLLTFVKFLIYLNMFDIKSS